MKVPTLKSFLELNHINDILSKHVHSLRLIRNLSGDTVLISSELKDSYYTIDITSKSSIRVRKLKLNGMSIDNEFKFLDNLRVISRDKPVKRKLEGKVLNVCIRGRCVNIKNPLEVTITNVLNSYLGVVRFKKGYLLFRDEGISNYKEVHIDGTKYLVCIVVKKERDNVSIDIRERFGGGGGRYNVPCKSVGGLICNNNLCLLECGDGSWALSLNNIYTIPTSLKPLIRCGDSDYFYDENYKMIVKSNEEGLKPLSITEEPMYVECLANSKLIARIKSKLVIIDENLIRPVASISAHELTAINSTVLIRVGNEYRVLRDEELTDILIRSPNCTLINDDEALCILVPRGKPPIIALLDLGNVHEPFIDVLNNHLDEDNYIKIKIRPWFPTTRLTLSENVINVESNISNYELEVSLRPKILGLLGTTKVYVEDPLFTTSLSTEIVSKKPRIREAKIINAVYVENGSIYREGVNLVANLGVLVENPTPDTGLLLILVNGKEVLKSEVSSGLNNLKLSFMSNVSGELVSIGFKIKYRLTGDEYYLGSLTLRPKDYVVENPLAHIVTNDLGDELIIKLGVPGAMMNALCLNGYRVSDLANTLKINMRYCEPPILLNLKLPSDPPYILNKVIIPKLSIKTLKNDSFDASLDGKVLYLRIPKVKGLLKDLEIINVGNDIIARVITHRVNIPAMLIYSCGSKISSTLVMPGDDGALIRCSSEDLLKGLHLIAMVPGSNDFDEMSLNIESILKKVIKVIFRNAILISKYVWGVSK